MYIEDSEFIFSFCYLENYFQQYAHALGYKFSLVLLDSALCQKYVHLDMFQERFLAFERLKVCFM